MRPLLVTGAQGQLGWELVRALAPLGPVLACSRTELDLTRIDQLRDFVRRERPAVVLNAAAYTAVDRAEQDGDAAWLLNAQVPGVLAELCQELGALLVHYSTDYVFDGISPGRPWHEDDATGPINAYGHTKLAGERAIQAVGGDHLILRTSWVYGARGQNFLRTILRLAAERDELRIVDDQYGAPTWSRYLAEATASIVRLCWRDGLPTALDGRAGVYHLSAGGQVSWYQFAATALARIAAMDPASPLLRARLHAVPSAAYPTAASRPAWSVLDNGKLRAAFGVHQPDWQHLLRLVLESWPQP